ncbi:CatB-related O-acetyltransferase [Celerinatantimonas sp. MCCC 1A17872]|uniref:CatB-related O-acetyltransferase n=1 Tax=Celerinatantimonas sp. MCCC 1A17872 TaxID=3177514 RepID=UPI0038C6B953
MGLLNRFKWQVTSIKLRLSLKGFYSSIRSVSVDCSFSEYVRLYGNTSLNNCCVGRYTYFAGTKSGNATFGQFCCIGPNTIVGGLGTHPTNMISCHPAFYSLLRQAGDSFVSKSFFSEYKETNIGNDVWIGANAIVLDGVCIGNGVIVGAGAVVVKDIPPYAIVAGVPAKVIRYRYSQEKIDALQRIKWWNCSREELKLVAHIFRDNDVDKLYSKFYSE